MTIPPERGDGEADIDDPNLEVLPDCARKFKRNGLVIPMGHCAYALLMP